MSSRVIRSHGGTQSLRDYLISLFALETVLPSREIYLISPFLSNAPLTVQAASEYVDAFPLVQGKELYLSDVIKSLAWKGCKVRLICDPYRPETQKFLHHVGDAIEVRRLENNHEKGLITENFYLHGSMNFTYRGIHINGESVRITTDVAEVNQALLSARARWEEASYT